MEEESRGETDEEEGGEGGQEKSTGEGAAVEVRVRRPVQCTVQQCTFSARQFFVVTKFHIADQSTQPTYKTD